MRGLLNQPMLTFGFSNFLVRVAHPPVPGGSFPEENPSERGVFCPAEVKRWIARWENEGGAMPAVEHNLAAKCSPPCAPNADAKHALTGVSTYPIALVWGRVQCRHPQPGKYPIVDHNMRDMIIGAAGELQVTP